MADPKAQNSSTLKVLTWNVKMLPGPGGEKRGSDIVQAILGNEYDIICLQETFDEDIRQIFDEGFRPRYKYRVPKVSDGDIFNEDSGLYFASKYEIKGWNFEEFKKCSTTDCFADKGVFSVRIDLSPLAPETTLLLFHIHAQSDEQYKETRTSQLRQIREKICKALRRYARPEQTAILLCGDMNVIGDVHPEYRMMISTLGYPRDLFRELNPDKPGYTWDAKENINMIPADDHDQQRLDYILAYDNFYADGDKSEKLVHLNCTVAEVQMFETSPNARLSDHFGVEATLTR